MVVPPIVGVLGVRCCIARRREMASARATDGPQASRHFGRAPSSIARAHVIGVAARRATVTHRTRIVLRRAQISVATRLVLAERRKLEMSYEKIVESRVVQTARLLYSRNIAARSWYCARANARNTVDTSCHAFMTDQCQHHSMRRRPVRGVCDASHQLKH